MSCVYASWIVVTGLAGASGAGERVRYDQHALVEVLAPDRAALDALHEIGVDPWTETPRPGWVPVLIAPDRRAQLDATGWLTRVVVEDVQPWVDNELDRLALRPPVAHGGDPFADFRDLDEIEALLAGLVASAPELASEIVLGMSIEGRPIRGIRIGTGEGESPAMYIQGGQHAREWISVSTAMWVATRFVEGAAEPELAALLGDLDLVVVPVVNPDGYVHSWDVERFWRKNRRDGIGVDTNRNFGVGWGGDGSSFVPQEDNFAGAAAFSEPESAAVRDYVLGHPELVAFVDLHSFGQLLLWPWGHIDEPAPDDAALSAMGQEITEAMLAVHQTTYTPIQGIDLYPAAGNAIDWAYGDGGLRSFTIELRPFEAQDFTDGFVLPPAQIVPVGEETMAAMLVIAQWAAEQGGGDTGSEDSTGGSTGSTTSGEDGTDTVGLDESTTGDAGSTTGASDDAEVTSGVDDAGEGSGSSGSSSDDDAGGCACAASPSAPPTVFLLGLLGLRRRSRRYEA